MLGASVSALTKKRILRKSSMGSSGSRSVSWAPDFFLERLIISGSKYLSGKTLPQQNFHQVLTTDPRIFDQFGVHANWRKARHGVDFIQ